VECIVSGYIEPLESKVLGTFLPKWQGVGSKRRGLDALLDAIETLQGVALPLSEWEREILPVRIRDYDPADLDTLMAAGEVVWVGRGQLGEHDGRVALYLSESLPALMPPVAVVTTTPPEDRAKLIAATEHHSSRTFTNPLAQAFPEKPAMHSGS
jgi:ATP-dependent Lhr-like helicase